MDIHGAKKSFSLRKQKRKEKYTALDFHEPDL